MKEPPFHHLRSGRIIPEFRRHILIFFRKAVQIKDRLHICRPEIKIVPPDHSFSGRQSRDRHKDDNRHDRSRFFQFCQEKSEKSPPLFLSLSDQKKNRQKEQKNCQIIRYFQTIQKRKTIQHKHKNTDSYGNYIRKRFFCKIRDHDNKHSKCCYVKNCHFRSFLSFMHRFSRTCHFYQYNKKMCGMPHIFLLLS